MCDDMDDWRPVLVSLRDTVTGDTRVYASEGLWDEGGFNDFIWSEGNFACDCNRSRFLWDDDARHLPCGVKRIVIDKIVAPGSDLVLYADA